MNDHNPMAIVNLINEYVRLEKDGVHYKGCCPFHKEKTPSFFVNVKRQIWHCFGCHRGGDAGEFLRQIEEDMKPGISMTTMPDQETRDRQIDESMMKENAKLAHG